TEARKQIRKLCQRWRPDVALLLNVTNFISPSIIDELRSLGVPSVWRISDFGLVCASYGYFRNGKLCFECRDSMINAIRHRCVQHLVAARLVRVAGNAAVRTLGSLHRVGAFIAPSTYMQSELVRLGIPPSQIRLLLTPFWDLRAISPQPPSSTSSGKQIA